MSEVGKQGRDNSTKLFSIQPPTVIFSCIIICECVTEHF